MVPCGNVLPTIEAACSQKFRHTNATGKCDRHNFGHIFNYYFTKVDITLASVKSFSYICSRFQEVGKDIGKKVTLETHKGNIEVMSGLSKPNFNYKSLKPY